MAALVSACSTPRPSPTPSPGPAQSRFALKQLVPGAIVISAGAQPTAISFDPPSTRVESASEGAENAARRVMDTPNLGHPQLEAVAGVFCFAAAPFAAAYGAVAAHREHLSPGQLSNAESDLREALQANAGSDFLRNEVGQCARQQTRRLLVCRNAPAADTGDAAPVSAVLEVTVEQLRLISIAPDQYVLRIEARVRLLDVRGTVLLDRRYPYESGPDMFVDWARQGGVETVAQTGYHVLAEQIAREIFQPPSEPALRLGPGQIGIPGRRKVSLKNRGFHFVGLGPEAVTSIDVHARGTGDASRLTAPASDSPEAPSPQTDTEYKMDGLVDDRNFVVQTVSCFAAVPMGLWEQTVGAVRKHSLEKKERLAKRLEIIPDQIGFESKVADEVARRLRSDTGDLVRRTEEPLQVGSVGNAQVSDKPGANTNSALALDIQVLNAGLVPTHGNSASRALSVRVQATLLRTSDGQELYRQPIVYRSAVHKLKDWAGADGRMVREELDASCKQASQALAEELVRRHLLTTPASQAGHNRPLPPLD
ncbi:MAG TPA: hypothetical protein VG167_03705 [Verrucomicrobiae bacterium]|nr:hypothetical protein [Verrucomicrobiae bacterium]